MERQEEGPDRCSSSQPLPSRPQRRQQQLRWTLTWCDLDAERAVWDLGSGKEDVDGVEPLVDGHVLHQEGALLAYHRLDAGPHRVLAPMRVQDHHVHVAIARTWFTHILITGCRQPEGGEKLTITCTCYCEYYSCFQPLCSSFVSTVSIICLSL